MLLRQGGHFVRRAGECIAVAVALWLCQLTPSAALFPPAAVLATDTAGFNATAVRLMRELILPTGSGQARTDTALPPCVLQIAVVVQSQ